MLTTQDVPQVAAWIPQPSDAPEGVGKYILYHAGCSDGFGAAYCFWKQEEFRDAHFVPVRYGKPFPDIPEGSWVWVVDFSYSQEEIPSNMGQVIILDHHKTALDSRRYAEHVMSDFGLVARGKNYSAFVDITRSGVGIAWDYLSDGPLPSTLVAVQDRDLWAWKYKDSDKICLGLDSYKMEFPVWDKVVPLTDHLIEKGAAIKSYQDNLIERAMSHVRLMKDRDGSLIPVVNSTHLPSEIGNAMWKKYFEAPYVVVWNILQNDQVYASFRSSPQQGADVSEIAARFGGGGHRNSAGARMSMTDFQIEWTTAKWHEVARQ